MKLIRWFFIGAFTLISLLTLPAMGVAQDTGNSSPGTASAPLPINRVSMFTSGVGYFQHGGSVTGDEEITLNFSRDDINDILKSLVIQDFGGGTVETVTYPSQDPLSRILESFSLDISDSPPLIQILNRTRGEEVVIEGTGTVTGKILSIEFRTLPTEKGSRQRAFLNLLTDRGIVQRSIEDVRSISFTDHQLQEELESALKVIAENRQEDRKSVVIRFSGEGERQVRIGYIRQVPVWKTSYRIVIGENEEEAQLQGWSIIENTGEFDWRGVRLSLVSELPVSFIMDLYSPVYTSRPELAPPAAPTVSPQVYERDRAPEPEMYSEPSMKSERMESAAADSGYGYFAETEEEDSLDLESTGVESAALPGTGAVYTIAEPVTIPRRSAAMVPIITGPVETAKVLIYDSSVLSNRPLKGIRFTNTTGRQLPAGPVTVFEGSTYSGDALLPELVPGEERLASYAVDLTTAVEASSDSDPEDITSIKITGGYLRITYKQMERTEYRISRTTESGAELLILHPKRYGWELASDVEPASETSGAYRFSLELSADTDIEFTVPLIRITRNEISLLNIREDQILYYLSQQTIDDETSAELERVKELKDILTEKESARRKLQEELSAIFRDQERIRKNLQAIDSSSDLYRRYLAALTEQEDRIEQLEKNLEDAERDEETARKALKDYIDSI
ncbi:MAG: hypothetical protein ACLFST_02310 [Spirochaetia bacterium]